MNGRGTTSLAEQLTAQFYIWEKRGRGWQVWDYPVVLEPPFVPFVRYAPQVQPIEDDARHPGLLSRLWTRMAGRANETAADESADPSEWESVLPAEDDGEDDDLVEFQLSLPESAASTPELAERLILSLGACTAPVSFELLGFPERVVLQFTLRAEDAAILRTALATYVPEAVLAETRGFLATAWRAASGATGGIVDFGLSREFMLPLAVPTSFTVDPLLGFLAALQEMSEGERGLVQVLFTPTAYPWADSALRAITDGRGAAFFIDAPETVNQTAEKIASPLFAAVVRVAARARTEERAWQIARSLGSGFAQLGSHSANDLIPLDNDNYPVSEHEDDVVSRRSHRSGMLLSAAELAAIVHLPSPSVRIPSLRGSARTTKAAPAIADADADGVTLGENTHRGKTVTVKLGQDLRFRHTYVIGATGTGKSTLLKNLIRQEIEAGQGVALLDPHGDLVEDVLGLVPDERHGDVVLFDPSDEEFPIGFNILRAHSGREKDLLASDLVAIFRRFSTSWGDQMTAVLGNAILAFLESDGGGTLVDLRRFLVEREFRERFLKTVSDPQVPYFWEREFPLLSGRPQMPILTRLDAFLRQKSIRYMVAQKESKLDLGAVMDDGRIFLAKLAQGAIGEENAHLLGSLLVAKFHQMALAREGLPESERRPFTIVIDEVQHFATPSLGAMLSGTRKYRVGLVLAHQELRQLRDSGLESAALTNPATRICFRVGDDDARKLAEGFSGFDAHDLQSLGVGEAICRIERADQDFNVRIPAVPAIEPVVADARRRAIRDLSCERYGVSRNIVETSLAEAFARPVKQCVDDNAPLPHTPNPASVVAKRPESPRPSLPKSVTALPKGNSLPPLEKMQSKSRPPVSEASAGRGGPRHKYLQTLIKHYGEDRGLRATVEAVLPNGGRIDVLLERGDFKLACEISVTSTPEQELGNIEKCLAAGIRRVIVVSPMRKTLIALETAAQARSHNEGDRVSFVLPEELLRILDDCRTMPQPETAYASVLGYRVKTKLADIDVEQIAARTRAVTQTILGAMKRLG